MTYPPGNGYDPYGGQSQNPYGQSGQNPDPYAGQGQGQDPYGQPSQDPYAGQNQQPYPGQQPQYGYDQPVSGSYGYGFQPPPEKPSRTPVIVLVVVGAVLLAAILGVGGFLLLSGDDDSGDGDDKASSESESPKPSDDDDDPTPSDDDDPTPSEDLDDAYVGNSRTPYKFGVPSGFEEVTPPSSTYVEGNYPTYEHAVSPKNSSEANDAIIISAWTAQGQDGDDMSDTELKEFYDKVAENLGHTDAGEKTDVDGTRAATYSKSDVVNTFVMYGTTFIQIRCQFYDDESTIKSGCDEVLDSFKLQ